MPTQRLIRMLLVAVAIAIAAPGWLQAADFEAAMNAYQRGDYAAAAQSFRALAGAGDRDAQYMLGRMYADGQGVVQDYVEAHKWFNLAASQGHRHAGSARDGVAGRMTSAQIAEAQGLARAWQPQTAPTPAAPMPAAPPPAQDRPDRNTVAGIQQALNDLGYDAGPVDGQMGRRTETAIRSYQAARGLGVDGRPSAALLEHLQGGRRPAGPPASVAEAPAPAAEPAAQVEEWPWQRLLLRDAFRDGNYTANPAWRVVAGDFRVESGLGLRTVHEARQAPAPAAASEPPRPEEFPKRVLGAILDEAVRAATEQVQQPQQPAGPDYAEIYLPHAITNAFAIDLQFAVGAATDRLELGVYQGGGRNAGYRLFLDATEAPPLRLMRVSRSGSSVVESGTPPGGIGPGRRYALQWTRDRDGLMVLRVDGETLFEVGDRGFSDPFDGFVMINRGGDYALGSIAVHGAD